VIVLLPLAALAFRRGWLFAVLLVVGPGAALSPEPVMAFGWEDLWQRPDQRAAAAFAEGDLEQARNLATTSARAGSAAYRLGDFGDAAERFAAADGAVDHYNRGNALARGGRFEDAIAAYDAALERDPGLEDAAYNRAQVQAALEEQQRQQQAQQQSPQSSGSQNREAPSDGEGASSQQSEQQSEDQSGAQADAQSNADDSQQQDGLDGQDGSSQAEGQHSNQPQPASDGDQASNGESSASDQASEAEPGPSETQEQAPSQAATEGDSESTTDSESGSEQSERAAADYRAEADAARADAQADRTETAAFRSEASDEGAGEEPGLTAEEREARQAADQWLRRIPDDPAELLRRKFLYQYQARQTDDDVLATGQPW
jgi:Ca-activated chloride channel family protein